MAKVDITVNGRSFAVGCEPGEEEHLRHLAKHFDRHVSRLAERVGQIGDLRLFLMAGLVISDELAETVETNRKNSMKGEDNARAARSLTKAAERIEALIERTEKSP